MVFPVVAAVLVAVALQGDGEVITRILKHLTYPRWWLRRAFPRPVLQAIEAAITASEALHDGELRFVVEGGLDLADLWRGLSARQRAIAIFAQLGVWDTEHNSGVLVYVQLADQKVEIVADRGIHKKVGVACWQRICADMEAAFRCGEFQRGALQCIQAVGAVLAEHFPAHEHNPDELPNTVELL